MTQTWTLGIDGGGTGCRARLLGPEGHVVGEGQAGSANIATDLDGAWASILEASEAAFAAAGADSSVMARTRAGLGLAGGNVPRCVEALTRKPSPFLSMAVRSDAEIACLGAHGGANGGILILGTGSQGIVVTAGRSEALGGWGFALSDTGSGAVLGHRAARRALLGHEAIEPQSAFTRALMDRFGADPSAMLAWAQTARPRDWATLAPLVFDYADAGDAVALELVRRAAGDVGALIARLVALGAGPIALMGGLSTAYVPHLSAEAARPLVPARGDALDGALVLARRV